MRWILLSLVALGCGSDTSTAGDGWMLEPGEAVGGGDAVEAVAEPDECSVDADCGEDRYCYLPESCGAPRTCGDEYPPISAAPPIAVCGCDGAVRWANHGYPGPYRWEIGALAWDVSDGTPCNSDASLPFDFDIQFTLPLTAQAAGHTVLARLSDPDLETADRVVAPSDGVIRFEASGDAWVSFQVEVLIDGDDDGRCSVGDVIQVYSAAAEVNLETFEVRGGLTLSGQRDGDPCVHWP